MRSVLVILCLLLSAMAMQPAASAGILNMNPPHSLAPGNGGSGGSPISPGGCCSERCCGKSCC